MNCRLVDLLLLLLLQTAEYKHRKHCRLIKSTVLTLLMRDNGHCYCGYIWSSGSKLAFFTLRVGHQVVIVIG